MAEADPAGEILFLHACTLYESARTPTPRTVSGEAYDITALVSEREVPQHVQMVWHYPAMEPTGRVLGPASTNFHENQVDQLLRDMALPAPVAERTYRWYLEQRLQPEALTKAETPNRLRPRMSPKAHPRSPGPIVVSRPTVVRRWSAPHPKSTAWCRQAARDDALLQDLQDRLEVQPVSPAVPAEAYAPIEGAAAGRYTDLGRPARRGRRARSPSGSTRRINGTRIGRCACWLGRASNSVSPAKLWSLRRRSPVLTSPSIEIVHAWPNIGDVGSRSQLEV
jgi:hypothetical protein